MAAIAEYKKKEEVYMARAAELDEMTKARDEQRKYHDDLRLSFYKYINTIEVTVTVMKFQVTLHLLKYIPVFLPKNS